MNIDRTGMISRRDANPSGCPSRLFLSTDRVFTDFVAFCDNPLHFRAVIFDIGNGENGEGDRMTVLFPHILTQHRMDR